MTLVLNLYGGPGTGKSTTAALVFGRIKQLGVNAEQAHEFAKDLTWEKRHYTLSQQEYVAAKQIHRVQRLMGQVDVIVTDSPILFSLVYYHKPTAPTTSAAGTPEVWRQHAHDVTRFHAFTSYLESVHRSWNTLDVMLRRDPTRPYNPVGRNQTEDEARAIDNDIEAVLRQYCPGIDPARRWHEIRVDKDHDTHVDEIVSWIDARLDAQLVTS